MAHRREAQAAFRNFPLRRRPAAGARRELSRPRGVPCSMADDKLPILYVKPGCPWCEEVVAFLSEKGIGYREKDVTADAAARAEMQQKSGQTRAPTLDWNGTILADFGVDELVPFLRQQNVKLEDS
jgi:glutaredoxin 3